MDLFIDINYNGKEQNGQKDTPFTSIDQAKEYVKTISSKQDIFVNIKEGIYYLEKPLIFTADDCKEVVVTYRAYKNDKVVIKGAKTIQADFKDYKDGIKVANIDKNLDFEVLFINGKRQILARYPNYDENIDILNGYAADAIDPSRVAKWSNPKGGFVRALHNEMWGGNSFTILSKNSDNSLNLKWAGDNNREDGMHVQYRMVENIFEELDSENEWFYNREEGKLYFYPSADIDLVNSTVEIAVNPELIRMENCYNLSFYNIEFEKTNRTLFTDEFEPLLRSDWCIVRRGCITVKDSKDIKIEHCKFTNLGGNAIVVTGYGDHQLYNYNDIYNIGASAFLVAGDESCVRNPSHWGAFVMEITDFEVGPKNEQYPRNITISNNIIHKIGVFEKQVAGVCLSMAYKVTISHNSIYDGPRSGINICDGCFGGHIIEYNDAFDLVKESCDHGPFNSWGRDRFFSHTGIGGEQLSYNKKPYAFLDSVSPIIIRNNRFCNVAYGVWGIDLDDGTNNYEIYNNICINIGFKLREGFKRRVFNNIFLGGCGNFHCWYYDSCDEISNNLIINDLAYEFIAVDLTKTNSYFDYNVFYNNGKEVKFPDDWEKQGYDTHSVIADPMFVDAKNLDFTFKDESPCLKMGMKNIEMTFGRSDAPSPDLSKITAKKIVNDNQDKFLDANVCKVYSEGLKSVAGVNSSEGAFITSLTFKDRAERAGFLVNDLILEINGIKIKDPQHLNKLYNESGDEVEFLVRRLQINQKIKFNKKILEGEYNE